MRGHISISSFIGIIVVVEVIGFCKDFKLSDDSICVFRIVFCYEYFNIERIKTGHVSLCGIDSLADGFRKVNKSVENELQFKKEILFDPGDFRGIRSFVKTAEVPQRFGTMEKS